jgi:hypothetical protein
MMVCQAVEEWQSHLLIQYPAERHPNTLQESTFAMSGDFEGKIDGYGDWAYKRM